MAADLSVIFTGIRFENPFLLSSAPPTESDTQHHAGLRRRLGRRRDQDNWTAPCRQRRRTQDQVPARDARIRAPLDAEAAGHRAPLLVELGADLRQDARLVGAADRPNQEGLSEQAAHRVHHGGLRQRPGTRALADAGQGLPGRRRGCVRVEPVVPSHGSRRTWDRTSARTRSSFPWSRRWSRKSHAFRSGPS